MPNGASKIGVAGIAVESGDARYLAADSSKYGEHMSGADLIKAGLFVALAILNLSMYTQE